MVDIPAIRAPLFVPANRPDRFEKAGASGADAVILDLEDAVAPADKAAARASLRSDFADVCMVRVNALGTPWHDDDIAAVRALDASAVMLPKAENAAAVLRVSEALGGTVPILALIETAKGLAAAREIAALACVRRLCFGSIDFCADLGLEHLRETLRPVRLELVLASRLSGLAAPIDGVTTAIDDPAVTQDDALHARSMGMGGKLCIHPRQVAEVIAAFRPTDAERDWAMRVLALGEGVHTLDGEMIDAPVRLRARAIIEAASSARL